VFIGMLKLDGQKTIWLQQFALLDRRIFEMECVAVRVTSAPHSNGSLYIGSLSLTAPPHVVQVPSRAPPTPSLSSPTLAPRPCCRYVTYSDDATHDIFTTGADASTMLKKLAAVGVPVRRAPLTISRDEHHVADAALADMPG
jgi:hypothetical protein